ncbi:MAG: OmpA family protein [Verrucomicrobia bacterium]|jgi:outer membrane protein OmpA-like peptidoglycan-associated protein|nr:OmpA family protein [Verrucomicrobiota bacterium]|tara:strand:+ start:6518 stop:7711 length:1194 start_codon:yes stop_codon:yes gene_type:complete
MSDEKKVEKTHTETVATESPAEERPKAFGFMNPVVFLLFMIFAMVVVLVVVSTKRSNGGSNTETEVDDPAIASLKADIKAGEMELNRQRMAMGLPPLENGAEPIGEIADRLKTDADTLVALAGRFQQMLGEKDAEITARSAELLRSEQIRQDLISENTRLNSEYQRALITGSETQSLNQLLADSQATRDALSDELTKVRQQLVEMSGAVSGDEFSDLQRRFNETLRSKEFFENRVKELEAELGQMRIFAKSEDELLPAAVELFRRLRKLEGQKGSDLNAEYSKLGVELGANVLHTLDFQTGSSELSEADMAQILQIAQDGVPDGDLTLIVGYASKTGDPTKNQKLSSDRATTAAEHFARTKRAGQRVQAVYLGQTNRFSSARPERNQICEVWRIRAK